MAIPNSKNEPLSFRYVFTWPNGKTKIFQLLMDRQSLDLIPSQALSLKNSPSWTQLSFKQCPNCPLKPEEVFHCPVAFNLQEIIPSFAEFDSYEKVTVKVETDSRSSIKETTVQKGLSSLLGLAMASAGCPILNRLKPMARFHLPLASLEETQYRILGMYVLSQFFRTRNGHEADWSLDGLTNLYKDIQVVNRSFCERLDAMDAKDAVPNAVVILNNFANSLLFAIDQGDLARMEIMFKEYLEPVDQ